MDKVTAGQREVLRASLDAINQHNDCVQRFGFDSVEPRAAHSHVDETRAQPLPRAVWADWSDRLPARPLCGDILADGTHRRPRLAALSYPHLEFNSAGRLAWMNFDIDTSDSFEVWERAHLPVPNGYVQNRANGHGHLLYALTSPLGVLGLSHEKPIQLAADIQRA